MNKTINIEAEIIEEVDVGLVLLPGDSITLEVDGEGVVCKHIMTEQRIINKGVIFKNDDLIGGAFLDE